MYSQKRRIRHTTIVFIDYLTTVVSYFIAVNVRNILFEGQYTKIDYFDFPQLLVLFIFMWCSILTLADFSVHRRFTTFKQEIMIGVVASLFGSLIVMAFGFLSKDYYPRSLIVSYALIFIVLYVLQKMLIIGLAGLKNEIRERILIIGAGIEAQCFIGSCNEIQLKRYEIIGLLSEHGNVSHSRLNNPVIGSYQDLKRILENNEISQILFALPHDQLKYLKDLMPICEEIGITIHVINFVEKSHNYKAHFDEINGVPSIRYSINEHNEVELVLKRIMDIVLSSLLLVTLFPVFIIIAVLIKITSNGPLFYKWKVVGKNNRDFVGYKFRTMVSDADDLKKQLDHLNEMKGGVFKIKNDPRITSVGRYLRKFSLDELPQLWSVLKGDMSLIGPRPPFRHELERFEFWQRRKISFKPGMTCLWQVRGRNSISDFSEWCRLDLEYIDNWSLWLDFKILLRTVWVVIRGTGC